jgi:putative transcriptional regulator
MAIVRFTLDPANPPIMAAATKARLEAMTDEEITAAAQSDPDNPPLTDQEIARIRAIRIARRARERAGLTQAAFAEAFAVNLSRLRDIEQGRKTPDRVLVSFLALVADDPERARRVVAETL